MFYLELHSNCRPLFVQDWTKISRRKTVFQNFVNKACVLYGNTRSGSAVFYRLISSNHSPFELRVGFIDIFMSFFDHLNDNPVQACAVQQHLLARNTILQATVLNYESS